MLNKPLINKKALYLLTFYNRLRDSLVENQYIFSVSVKTAYLPEQSNEEENRFAFAYTVTITNVGTIAAQLISRHWVITDADGNTNEVRGLGLWVRNPYCSQMNPMNIQVEPLSTPGLVRCMAATR